MKHTLRTLERDGIAWEAVLNVTTAEAKALWGAHRGSHPVPLLTAPDANQKIAKDQETFKAWSLSLAPHRDGGTNVCPASTPACRKHCVSYAGKGGMSTAASARRLRTSFLMTQPAAFMRLVVDEIDRAATKCERDGIGMAMRLNAFSDVAWERVVPWLFEMFDGVRFYDYTKRTERVALPSNYSLTVSRTERTSMANVQASIEAGQNVAVIFDTPRSKPLPETYGGVPVIDGDESDLRFKDPDGVVVGLRAKGSLRSDNTSGFAVQVTT